MAVIISDLCVACGACIDECPTSAIFDEFENKSNSSIYFVKDDLCVECLGYAKSPLCAHVCPIYGCITWGEVDNSPKFRKNIKYKTRAEKEPIN